MVKFWEVNKKCNSPSSRGRVELDELKRTPIPHTTYLNT